MTDSVFTDIRSAPLHGPFKLRCPDGRVRWVVTRRQCGFARSAHSATRSLWWHDLVDWRRVGLGPATWNWSNRQRCSSVAPNGRGCSLPVGHVFYLNIGHRLSARRPFVQRVTSYWPKQDPKRREMAA